MLLYVWQVDILVLAYQYCTYVQSLDGLDELDRGDNCNACLSMPIMQRLTSRLHKYPSLRFATFWAHYSLFTSADHKMELLRWNSSFGRLRGVNQHSRNEGRGLLSQSDFDELVDEIAWTLPFSEAATVGTFHNKRD